MKIGKYFTTYSITAGLGLSILGSMYLYMAYFQLSNRLIETIAALLFLYFLIRSDTKTWFWSGFFISLLWFWWILVSFQHYHMLWVVPFGLVFIGLVYGVIFWIIGKIAQIISPASSIIHLLTKAIGLLLLSYLHPLGFDWLKPELIFVHTYLGVNKWQFALVLAAIVATQYKKNILFMVIVLFAYSPTKIFISNDSTNKKIALANTMISVEDKWNPKLVPSHIKDILQIINKAINEKKKMVILPESVFPFFLNKEPKVLGWLLNNSHKITIIIGALYLDGKIHRNSTYIIENGRYTIANKVVLVPFGESNPLPDWAGAWINSIFFDGAIDYTASAKPTDFKVDGTVYRNAICYEATSEILYSDKPKHMIVISNNGWFTPSIEPTLQRLLLEFYSRKYGTSIYHSINMSPSYTIRSNKYED